MFGKANVGGYEMSKLIYGWKPDVPDFRDVYFALPQALKSLPPSVDLTSICPPVYSQGRIGSCTAQAIGASYQVSLVKQRKRNFMPSRLFLYYNARAMINSTAIDSGAMLRDCIKSIAKQGVCPEPEWTYDDTPANPITGRWPSNAKPARRPSNSSYSSALKRRAVSYARVTPTLDQIKGVLAEGFPIVFGFSVYTSFESGAVASTGVVNMPQPGERLLGGHAVMMVGYNDATKRVIVRNSWGASWGQKGYFTMPYDYVTNSNLADDFWVVRSVTN